MDIGPAYELRDGRPVHVAVTDPSAKIDGPLFSCSGKEVLRDGSHFADAIDQDAARTISEALNFYGK